MDFALNQAKYGAAYCATKYVFRYCSEQTRRCWIFYKSVRQENFQQQFEKRLSLWAS